MALFPRTVSRLMAIQVLFQKGARQDLSLQAVLDGVHAYGLGKIDETEICHRMDEPFFLLLVHGAYEKGWDLERKIEPYLPQGWIFEKMEPSMRYLLWCSTFELAYCCETPKEVIFNEYITLSHGLLLPNSFSFINALLEKALSILSSEKEKNQ